MKVNFLSKLFALPAYSIKKPLAQINSGKAKVIGINVDILIVLVERIKKVPNNASPLNEYDIL
jgi:hypothetical protein